eukprot:m51a1_g7979 hypothetical protein (149) ;mRNA; f:48341-49283
MVRVKNRYALARVVWDAAPGGSHERLGVDALRLAVFQALDENYGPLGRGRILQAFSIKYFSAQTGVFVIRSPRAFEGTLLSALVFVRAVGGTAATVRVLHRGGTVKSCVDAGLAHDRALLARFAAEHAVASPLLGPLAPAVVPLPDVM